MKLFHRDSVFDPILKDCGCGGECCGDPLDYCDICRRPILTCDFIFGICTIECCQQCHQRFTGLFRWFKTGVGDYLPKPCSCGCGEMSILDCAKGCGEVWDE